jgi:uncharacterized YigZ family protein
LDSYYTIEQTAMAEYKDRGSRFIAYATPINTVLDFKTALATYKNEHPKAVHHCFAYRLGTVGNIFRVSDDGEPSGSAGRPILGQIDSKQITNVAIVVVRYFGGTLLGVPGLINAYKTAATLALQVVPIVEKSIEIPYRIECNYEHLNDVMTILKQYNCTIISQEKNLFCLLHIGIAKNRLELALKKLGDLHHINIQKI